ncbi:SLATT domain-containing protein [uncultured Sphingomonas sp.]|uniref:SLATT domain-containing protein n=1 Tax=uncultured Sphingomonas sp. TaxID=158754 RepID=UPI0025F95892|nr:SLATT domain-containing protein [uncultured Sphingomonas sp.]
MSDAPNSMIAIKDELERIEEDCIHSGKAQFNAGVRWSRYHLLLGVPAVILSALAGTAFFKDQPEIAGVMSTIVAILTALSTFLKPSERASSHKGSGDQYLTLRNDARVLRTIKLDSACDEAAAIANLDEITKRRNELNQASAQASRSDFEKARKGIDEGEAAHRVDRKES